MAETGKQSGEIPPREARLRRVESVSKVDLAENELRRALASGRWGENMPGLRPVAAALRVSVRTAAEAVARLTRDGWLEPAGGRKRHRIPVSAAPFPERDGGEAESGGVAGKTVLVMTPQQRGDGSDAISLTVVARLWEQLSPAGWRVTFHMGTHGSGGRRRRRWDGLLASERPDVIVAVLGTPELSAWAESRAVRMIFCGGSAHSGAFPNVGFSSAGMAARAFQELAALGHRDICMPLNLRSAPFVEGQRRAAADALAAAGLPFSPPLHTPAGQLGGPEGLRGLLAEVWRVQAPTAVVCLDWGEYLCARDFVERVGLSIPRDISFILLSENEAVEWIAPRPAHFLMPTDTVVKRITRLIRRPPPVSADGNIRVPAVWVPGDSVGPPPKRPSGQNSADPGVRAKGMTSRILDTPVTNINNRSKPMP